MICPLQMKILLACRTHADGPDSIKESPAKADFIMGFVIGGIIRHTEGCWMLTKKGEVWLDAMLGVPEPVCEWRIPQ